MNLEVEGHKLLSLFLLLKRWWAGMKENQENKNTHFCIQKTEIALIKKELNNRKEANGKLEDEDKSLSEQMQDGFKVINARFDTLLFWLLGAMAMGVVALIGAAISLLITFMN